MTYQHFPFSFSPLKSRSLCFQRRPNRCSKTEIKKMALSFRCMAVEVAIFSLCFMTVARAFVIGGNRRGQQRSNVGYLPTSLNMATWSDSRAVQDYQKFLATGKQEIELKRDQPSVIISGINNGQICELAEALFTMGFGDDLVISPGYELPSTLDDSAEYPIYVTLPPYQLADFIKGMPEAYKDRVDDMVFFSGGLTYGNIEDVLKTYSLCRDCTTQVLISGLRFTAAKRVEDISVRLGTAANEEEKWAGMCAACGKWNGAIADRLQRNSIQCRTDFYREWRRLMWEKSISDAVFHLVGAVRSEPPNIATVANYYGEEVGDMLWEMNGLLRGWKALTLTFGFEERIFGEAEVNGAEQPCALINEMYDYVWGQQVFLESPTFLQYLHFAQGELGWLQGIQLPPTKEEANSKMRHGNLRADGVV